MYAKNDKRRLYELINLYLSETITILSFCDEFYYSFIEIDPNDYTEIETEVFYELNDISNRFSQYEEDHKLDSHAFYTEIDVRKKIIEIKKKLKSS